MQLYRPRPIALVAFIMLVLLFPKSISKAGDSMTGTDIFVLGLAGYTELTESSVPTPFQQTLLEAHAATTDAIARKYPQISMTLCAVSPQNVLQGYHQFFFALDDMPSARVEGRASRSEAGQWMVRDNGYGVIHQPLYRQWIEAAMSSLVPEAQILCRINGFGSIDLTTETPATLENLNALAPVVRIFLTADAASGLETAEALRGVLLDTGLKGLYNVYWLSDEVERDWDAQTLSDMINEPDGKKWYKKHEVLRL